MPDSAATEPVPRTDANSQQAHQDLLAKAKAGGIDLYFLGDSITRRWGCTDPQYSDLLEHWRECFHGWNAANFGWGGDGIEHVRWRVENGELAGVNPKVIVLLAGTNNVGGEIGPEGKVDQVVAGMAALIETCRLLAPGATVVLMAIFPRNDHVSVLPEIEAINRGYAKLADGDRVRFLNINDRLADANGRLHDGIAPDGLHLARPGYQIWADALRPILTERLGLPAEIDTAPPPTGDPSATA